MCNLLFFGVIFKWILGVILGVILFLGIKIVVFFFLVWLYMQKFLDDSSAESY